MHTGKTAGWSGWIDWPAPPQQSPKHRVARRLGAPKAQPAEPACPRQDPLTDTSAGGLRKFDLGMVPASVTPPRSWRYAAWFAVASSVAALTGLLLATSALVSQPSPRQLPGFPSMPRGGEYPPLRTPDPAQLTGDPARPQTQQPPGTRRNPVSPATPQAQRNPNKNPEVPGTTASPVRPSSQPLTTSSRPPTRQAPQLLGLTNNDEVIHRSDQYFSAVSGGDLHKAYEMTTGALHDEGFESYAARYAGVTSIEVTDVYASSQSTITTLRCTRRDGTIVTQRRELRFTSGPERMVTSDRDVSR